MAEKTVPMIRGSKKRWAWEITRSQEHYMTPPVDIYETESNLVLIADLPGVSKDSLDISLEDSTLTIQGRTNHYAASDLIQREYELLNFFRQFELREKVDDSRITAELKHGVLTTNLPKAEVAKSGNIEVKVA
jgi:HSP20 family protein